MHEAIARMLSKYECQGLNDHINGLREILQEVSLLGLWRSKFFEKAAFYGGTALRVIYGLDRFSEDMDFSLLEPSNRFDIARYTEYLAREIKAFGFDVRVERIDKARPSPVQSANRFPRNARRSPVRISWPMTLSMRLPSISASMSPSALRRACTSRIMR